MPDPRNDLHRRAFLHGTGLGVGALAMNSLLSPELFGAADSGRTHHVPRVKSVIFLHMIGAPSQLDLFDYKPELIKFDRKLAPKEFVEGKRFAFLRGHPKLLGTPFQFARHGSSGSWVSELMPNLARVVDDVTFIKSMRTDEFNHAPAQMLFHTGLNRRGNPSLGAWINYGLGSPNENLPGYVVFISGSLPGGGSSLWGSGFLPSIYQGVEFRSQGEPVLFLNNPEGIDARRRRDILDGIQTLNRQRLDAMADPEIATRMEQYELAFRMQSSVPELMDLADEPAHVREQYGESEFASHCLYARRLVERGVRFVELFNQGWDTHGNQKNRLTNKCREVDQPIAALLSDLKQRGLLDETLVVFAGEFGRTPMLQGAESPEKAGRDHHKEAFTIFAAGGGLRSGVTYGATDEMGYHIAENPVEIRDFHATMLHLLGLDHTRVTFKFQGLDQRLTGVEEAHVIDPIVA